jgi:hypothetical protein
MNNKKIIVKDVELGQMMFGNPVGEYECPEYVEALLAYLFEEMSRVYWNKNQKEFDEDGNDDPEFKGIEVRPYYWGENDKEAGKPNFKYKRVEFRWYKHRGRSMTVNVSMGEAGWVKWFDDCLKCIRKNEPDLY